MGPALTGMMDPRGLQGRVPLPLAQSRSLPGSQRALSSRSTLVSSPSAQWKRTFVRGPSNYLALALQCVSDVTPVAQSDWLSVYSRADIRS